MPFARFYKLPPEKREGLLEVAAQEFVQHGFEEASINRILERAQMSKGAAYYYFEDKVDLFCTVVQHASERLQLVDQELDIAALTAENFWPTFADLHRLPLLRSYEQPWLFASLRVAGRLSPSTLEREPLATLAKQLNDLIFAWLRALDEASDQWLLTQWKGLDRTAIAQISDQTVDAMQRAMVP